MVQVDLGVAVGHPLGHRATDARALLHPDGGGRPETLHLGRLAEDRHAVGVIGDMAVWENAAYLDLMKLVATWPVIDLLKNYFQIEERDDARRIREKVAGKLLMLDRRLEALLQPLAALMAAAPPDRAATRPRAPARG